MASVRCPKVSKRSQSTTGKNKEIDREEKKKLDGEVDPSQGQSCLLIFATGGVPPCLVGIFSRGKILMNWGSDRVASQMKDTATCDYLARHSEFGISGVGEN